MRLQVAKAGLAVRDRARAAPIELACRAGYATEAEWAELASLRDALTRLTARLDAAVEQPAASPAVAARRAAR